MLIRKLIAAARGRDTAPAIDHPLEIEEKLGALHARAPARRHLDILYGEVRVGDTPYVDLYFRCLERTGTAVTPFNIFQRFQSRLDLLRYFSATLDLPGARVECGAYRGATALLLCHAWRSRHSAFDGSGFHLIDSFSGTRESTEHDRIPVRDASGATHMEPFFPPGKTDASASAVRGYFSEFPRVGIHEGWIPGVFGSLPDTTWAFVHLDLTLYEATLGALEYFHPRLSRGGVIVVDGSIFCPGAQKAVVSFSTARDVPYVALGHRESVFVKA